MNAPLRFGEPTEVADGVWAIPTDYPEAADAPLWVHLLRGPGSWSIVDCGVPTTWASCFEPAFARILGGVDALRKPGRQRVGHGAAFTGLERMRRPAGRLVHEDQRFV